MSTQPPHPPISCGTIGFPDGDVVVPAETEKRVEAILKASLRSSPNETKQNHMMGARGGIFSAPPKTSVTWIPQNKRLYYAFDKSEFTTRVYKTHTKFFSGGMGVQLDRDYKIRKINHGAEILVEDFFGCDMRIKKTQIEVLPKSMLNVPHEFVVVHHKDASNFINAQIKRIMEHSWRAVRILTEIHGGTLGEFLRMSDGDDEIRGDPFIDSIPDEVRFHSKHFKKTYQFKTEAKGSRAAGIYLDNAAARRVVPELVKSQDMLRYRVEQLPEVISRRQNVWDFMFSVSERFNALSKEEGDSFIRDSFWVVE